MHFVNIILKPGFSYFLKPGFSLTGKKKDLIIEKSDLFKTHTFSSLHSSLTLLYLKITMEAGCKIQFFKRAVIGYRISGQIQLLQIC
jgi:hypothetical protein